MQRKVHMEEQIVIKVQRERLQDALNALRLIDSRRSTLEFRIALIRLSASFYGCTELSIKAATQEQLDIYAEALRVASRIVLAADSSVPRPQPSDLGPMSEQLATGHA